MSKGQIEAYLESNHIDYQVMQFSDCKCIKTLNNKVRIHIFKGFINLSYLNKWCVIPICKETLKIIAKKISEVKDEEREWNIN